MKQLLITTAAAFALSAATLTAQAPPPPVPAPPAPGPALEVRGTYQRLKVNILKAADKMPEADFQYRPTPEIRTYARIINHITEAQFGTCAALNGTRPDPKATPSDTGTKAEVIAGLTASFAECDKAYDALTDANVTEILTSARGKRSRIGFAWGNVSHDNEQYAELSTYLRLKNLVPPTAEK